jgi:molybdenum cofactor sulfurtransferase
VNRLNESIKSASQPCSNPGSAASKKAVAADVFRANVVVAENISTAERPYIEDTWASLSIGSGPEQLRFDVLGSCERCQMVCVDQYTGQRGDEPYATLAKTRKIDRKILFGRHISPVGRPKDAENGCLGTIMVGDAVTPSYDNES